MDENQKTGGMVPSDDVVTLAEIKAFRKRLEYRMNFTDRLRTVDQESQDSRLLANAAKMDAIKALGYFIVCSEDFVRRVDK